MKTLTIVLRSLLGLAYFVFGLNGFLNFIPIPPMVGDEKLFHDALVMSNLFFVVKAMEVVLGALMLTNTYVAFASVLLAPITFNIFWFHANLGPEGLPLSLILVAIQVYLFYVHRDKFKGLLEVR